VAITSFPVPSKICAVYACLETNSNQVVAHIGVLAWTRLFEKIQTEIGLVWCSRGEKDLQDTMLMRQARPGRLRPSAMADSISFSSVAFLGVSALSTCSLCQSEPAWLKYIVDSDDGISDVMSGVCCAGCAQGLLESLEKLHAAELAAPNAAKRRASRPSDHSSCGGRTSPSVP
jgi:hypothetical protein